MLRIGNYGLDTCNKTGLLGKGNFAYVRKAIHQPTGTRVSAVGSGVVGHFACTRSRMCAQVAIKIIDKSALAADQLVKARREIAILKLIRHRNIVRLYEVLETDRLLFLVLEFCSRGELFDFLVANGRLRESDARYLFHQLVSAVRYAILKKKNACDFIAIICCFFLADIYI